MSIIKILKAKFLCTNNITVKNLSRFDGDVCVASGKKVVCNKIVPKDGESVHLNLVPINKFAHGKIWLTALFMIPVNTTPGQNPGIQLVPNNNQIIPFDNGIDSNFVYSGMLLSPSHWIAPSAENISACEFDSVWVEVCAKILINIDSGDIGDRIYLDLRKNKVDLVSRTLYTLPIQLLPGGEHVITLVLCELVKCDPEDTLDLFIWGWDINTTTPIFQQLLCWVIDSEYNSNVSFKIIDLEVT